MQHAAYDVAHRYEQLLNAGDAAGIVQLFAPDGVAEWNEKPTFVTPQEKIDAYNALFKAVKCSTIFGNAGIDVRGDTAVVRTFHHTGAAISEGGKEVVDLARFSSFAKSMACGRSSYTFSIRIPFRAKASFVIQRYAPP